MAEEKKLEQTKSQFKLRGIVTRLDKDDSVKPGEARNGKEYKRLNFGVKTEDNENGVNEIFVQLFGMVKDDVYAYSQKDKKSLKLSFSDRDNVPDGYQIIGVRVNHDGDAQNLTEWDAVDAIKDNFSDGDSVYVSGDIVFNVFENSQGETIINTQYQVRSISRTQKPIDFEDEKFKPMHAFEKEIVYVDSEKNNETNELQIIGREILYNEDFIDGTFVVDLNKYKKLAINLHKKLKFGDVIKLKGYCWNKAVVEEVQEPDQEDEFGGEDPTGFDRAVTRYENKLEVTSADGKSWIKKKYREDDFVKFIENEGDSSNPFEDEESSDLFSSDDDSFS